MNIPNITERVVAAMCHSPIHQYVVPGLTSWLVGGEGHGRVRLFTSERDTREWVTPHSHRFDFTCLVLGGEVDNIKFTQPIAPQWTHTNTFAKGILRTRVGGMGEYDVIRTGETAEYMEGRDFYKEGDVYAMRHDEIHSIQFGKGAQVIFFEGPNVVEESIFLEPFSNGKVVETFKVEPWMFERETA